MNSEFIIRELRKSEIPKLKDFAPEDWHFEFDNFLRLHFDKDYFLAIVMVKGDEIIATANAIMSEKIGWAANIIVAPSYQGKGLGYEITKHLIELMFNRVDSILLIATKMGEGLYKKFGFQTIESYSFSENKKIDLSTSKNIFPYEKKYLKDIIQLDFEATAEKRINFLEAFLHKAWLYVSDEGLVDGFYIQGFGDGMIIAKSKKAGKTLLEFKHSQAAFRTVVPASNTVALNHLKELGIEIKSKANRMVLGKDVYWQPQNIYSRIAGYCG